MDIKQAKQEMRELMRLHYGFSEFRPGQERSIDAVLAGRSAAVIMPTGGGKSLCFQLPALVLPGATIVISPLIALMKDQVDSLARLGVPATFINSSVSPDRARERLEQVKSGFYKILYIAPERFYNQEFIAGLKDIEVSLFAVDEAHCISQWGHDFRPSYLRLRDVIQALGSPPVLALTATATPEVRDDIIKQLALEQPELVITGFARPNLQFGVIQANEARKPSQVLDAVSSVPEGQGIIYVGTRARVDDLLQFLLENDIEAVGYHAGMDPEDRRWVQENFLSGRARVIIATNAFGLGIDKEDVRYVIHYDMPGTLEAYYQEAGRAGRDGRPSFCLLLYNSRDRALHEFFIKGDNPPLPLIREIYGLLLDYESDRIMITYADIQDNISDRVPDMAIGTALKILEKEGYLSRSRERSGQAWLKTDNDFQAIGNSISPKAAKQLAAWGKLSEKYPKEINKGWYFNPETVSEIINIKKETLMRLVRALKDKGLVEYKPPFKGTEINILKRVEPSRLEFDDRAIKAKMKAAYAKLEKMEDYVFDFGCRQKFILDYFGDAESRICGQCDACVIGAEISGRRENVLPRRPGDKKENHQARAKQEYVARSKPKNSNLSTKLTQLETLELYNKGQSIEEIARSRGLKAQTIFSHLAFLIEKGLLEDKNKLVDLVDKKTEEKVRQAMEKHGPDRLRPVYEELQEKVPYEQIRIVAAKVKRYRNLKL